MGTVCVHVCVIVLYGDHVCSCLGYVCYMGTVCVNVCVLSGDGVRCEDPAVSIQTELAMELLRDKHSQEIHSLRVELDTKVAPQHTISCITRHYFLYA